MSWMSDDRWTCPECNRTVRVNGAGVLRDQQQRHWKAHRASDRIVLELDSKKGKD